MLLDFAREKEGQCGLKVGQTSGTHPFARSSASQRISFEDGEAEDVFTAEVLWYVNVMSSLIVFISRAHQPDSPLYS